MRQTIKEHFHLERGLDKELAKIRRILAKSGPCQEKYSDIEKILVNLAKELEAAKTENIFEERTGFLDSAFGEEYLEKEIAISKRYKRNLSIALIDVDFLKYINDNFGHNIGTKAIVAVASAIRGVIRKSDVACRYGGDEFLVIFSDTKKDKVLNVIKRIQSKISSTRINNNVKIGISFGVAELTEKNDTVFRMIEAADKELYKAKRVRVNPNL